MVPEDALPCKSGLLTYPCPEKDDRVHASLVYSISKYFKHIVNLIFILNFINSNSNYVFIIFLPDGSIKTLVNLLTTLVPSLFLSFCTVIFSLFICIVH